MSQSDSTFFKPFAFVLGALVIFTLFIMFMANVLSPDSAEDPLAVAEQQKSIAPVGRSRISEASESTEGDAAAVVEEPAPEVASTEQAQSEDSGTDAAATEPETNDAATETATVSDASSAATVAATATGAAAGGEVPIKVKAAVATNCAGCHNAGLDGAALPDDAQAWSALADKGIDTLTASVIEGKGAMPARAESSLNDAEIKQAVQLMIATATGGAMGGEAADAKASGAESTATETNEAAAESNAASGAAATATAAATQVAEAPAEVKSVVDSVCAACHIAGVANAPKFGDKSAWEQRLAKGIDALTASAIGGIGAMPPRGGSALDDVQMKQAIEYMLTK